MRGMDQESKQSYWRPKTATYLFRKRSINVTLFITRLPAHSSYTSLYAVVNPSGPEPMPKEGPLRVYLSGDLAVKPPIPNTAGVLTTAMAHTSSPAGVVSSPATAATNASSPNANRKRKATEDAQISPRRAKFPPGTIGSTPATATPTIPPPIPPTVSTTGASVNNATQQPGSVNSMQAPPISGMRTKLESATLSLTLDPHVTQLGARSVIQPPPVGVRPPSASGTQIIPLTAQSTSTEPSSLTAAPQATFAQSYITKFLSDPPEERQKSLAKLMKVRGKYT
jgi:hypothetical protein